MPADSEYILLRGPYGLECRPHINSELEVIHVTQGFIDVWVGGVSLRVPEGHAVLIFPHQPHSFHPLDDATGRVYMFRFRIAGDFSNAHGSRNIRPFILPLSKALADYLKEAVLRAERQPDEITAKSMFFPLIAEYLEKVDTAAAHNPGNQLVGQIMDYILNHLQDRITLKTLSAHFGINTVSLSRLIKEYTYTSFTDFVNNIRIERAIELIAEYDVSVTDAAFQAGFGSVRNFNRVFQSILGITPSEYRRSKR